MSETKLCTGPCNLFKMMHSFSPGQWASSKPLCRECLAKRNRHYRGTAVDRKPWGKSSNNKFFVK